MQLLSKAVLARWYADNTTKTIKAKVDNVIADIQEDWAEGKFKSDPLLDAEMRGKIYGMLDVFDMDYDEE